MTGLGRRHAACHCSTGQAGSYTKTGCRLLRRPHSWGRHTGVVSYTLPQQNYSRTTTAKFRKFTYLRRYKNIFFATTSWKEKLAFQTKLFPKSEKWLATDQPEVSQSSNNTNLAPGFSCMCLLKEWLRAGVVGVVQPASTSDPASKQPCNNLQLPLRDDSHMKSWKTGKMSDSVGCAAEKGQILGR